jgi:O-antigen ligase
MARAVGLATASSCAAALLVLILFAPALQAPFLAPKFGVLEVTASLGFLAFAIERARAERPRWTRATTAGALTVLASSFIAWLAAAGRSYGSPYAVDAFARVLSLFGLACGASVLADRPAERRRVIDTITIGAAVVAAVGLLQHVEALPLSIPVISTPGSTFGNRNAGAEVMAMALPFGVAAVTAERPRAGRMLMLAATVLELVYLAVTRTRGAWVGAACGLFAALVLARDRWPRRSLVVGLVALAAAVAAASLPGRFNPRDANDRKRYSGVIEVLEGGVDAHSTALRTRFGLWRRTLGIVREHPLFGVGPGNWPVEFPRHAEPGASRDGVLSATLAPRQAHNDLLERAAETGLPGLAALVWLAWAAARATRARLRACAMADDEARDDELRAATASAAGALVSLTVLGLASFPLETPGTLAIGGLALGLIAVDTSARGEARRKDAAPNARAEDRSPRSKDGAPRPVAGRALVAAALGFVLCAGVRAEERVRASRWLGVAERAMRPNGAAGLTTALWAVELALRVAPNDYRARLRKAQVLLRLDRPIESAVAARHVTALEPYSPNGWAALAAAELEAGKTAAARRDATQAISLLHAYPFALFIRAKAEGREHDESASLADTDNLRDVANTSPDEDAARDARALLKEHDNGAK